MMSQHTVVYRYGCRAPRNMGDDVIHHVAMQYGLYNWVTAINMVAREEYNAFLAADPAVAGATAEIEQLKARRDVIVAALAARRKITKRREMPSESEQDELSAVRAKLAELYAQLKAAQVARREKERDFLVMLNARRNVSISEVRRRSAAEGLWWPNYNDTVARADAAYQRAVKDGSELRTKEWRGPETWTDHAGVLNPLSWSFQVQGGMSVEELFAGRMKQLSILPLANDAYDSRARKKQYSVLTFAIYPTVDGCYRALQVPIYLHRPMPVAARIMAARLQCVRRGKELKWETLFTCRVERTDVAVGTETCGIDVGWRLREGGALRIATVAWGEQEIEEISLPREWMADMDLCEDTESELAHSLADFKKRLLDWLPLLPPSADTLIAEIKRFAATERAGVEALGRLCALWGNKYPWADPDMLRLVKEWHSQHRQDIRARENRETRLRQVRLYLYRCAVKRIAQRASEIGIDATDLRSSAKRPAPTEEAPLPDVARRMRVRASLSEFRAELNRAAKVTAARVRGYSDDTNLCHSCGADPAPGDPSELIWRCANCGAIYDQDHNSALTIRTRCLADASADAVRKMAGVLDGGIQPKIGRAERLRMAKAAKRAEALENRSTIDAKPRA